MLVTVIRVKNFGRIPAGYCVAVKFKRCKSHVGAWEVLIQLLGVDKCHYRSVGMVCGVESDDKILLACGNF